MSAQAQPRLTVEQYLEMDRSLETRNEYYNRRMSSMSSGTFNHGLIIGNLTTELNIALRTQKKNCSVVPNDLRVCVTAGGLYTYPDIVVVCGAPEFVPGASDTLANPILLGEVLSPSTEAYDRGFKSAQYRQLGALREYILISQNEPRIEVMHRDEHGNWLISDFAGLDAICHLTSINGEISLADVYGGIQFEAAWPEPAHPSAAG